MENHSYPLVVCYASFKVADEIEGLALFTSDYMAQAVGNADKTQPVGFREKSMISFEVDNVDESYQALFHNVV